MTRDEAARVLLELREKIKVENGGIYDRMTAEQQRTEDAIDIAIASMRGPVSDPDTGLVPCGCGGKPEVIHEPGSWGYYGEKGHVRCTPDIWMVAE
jgi:hypothetical protein